MLKTLLVAAAVAFSSVLSGALSGCTDTPLVQPESQTTQVAVSTVPPSYENYGMVLRSYVSADGLVNYAALQNHSQPLIDFVTQLGEVAPSSYENWSEPDKIAFLINAYNAITLQSIISQTPLKDSIKNIFGVWNFNKHSVLGKSITLDTIEHSMLRKDFQEPRIHAALVCAAISCPPLRQEPYSGEKLEAQLDDQVRQWLSSPHGLKIDRAQNQVAISSIFKWFGEDWQAKYSADGKFTGSDKERAALNFIASYLSQDDQSYLAQGNYKLSYLDYDWSLNRQ
jgi:Protein of unknown function, DUF547